MNNINDICCIGHITTDRVVTCGNVNHMPGGTAFYFSCALAGLDVSYQLVTSLSVNDTRYVKQLRDRGVDVKAYPSTHTVCFENSYSDNQDERTQTVSQKADAFTTDQLVMADARFFHLGPLLADDIPVSLIKGLAAKGTISLDVQGYLRKVIDQKVYPADWPEKIEALQYVSIVKADVAELKALTGFDEVLDGVAELMNWGVKEVVITDGSKGSVIFCEGGVHTIQAFKPLATIDATGCGDTYMAGYLYKRSKGAGVKEAGEFAAAMASLKIGNAGPFTGTEADVEQHLSKSRQVSS